jgi:DNA/RNA-binding domain of Phe-tRNA-synthetase-like protein
MKLVVDLEKKTEVYEPLSKGELAQRDRDAKASGELLLRADRDALLSSSDWTQGPDAPLSEKKKEAWASYRQELRDLPAKTKDPLKVKWPEAPS